MYCSSSRPVRRRIPGQPASTAWPRVRGRARIALAVLAVALAASACGGSAAAPSAATGTGAATGPGAATGTGAGTVTIGATSLPGVGTVLVNAAGFALYMFVPDDQRQVTCTSLCAQTWPPVRLKPGAALVAGPGVKQALLGSDAGPAGGRVVTYDGWPLYAYTGDVYKGQTTGQGIDLNGGYWYVMRPSGQPLEKQLQ
jgi:predicted lipoprotein with Yx(FWY)xxD motif